MDSTASAPRVDYRTDPSQYHHWKLSAEGALARLTLDVAEDAAIRIAARHLIDRHRQL